jgi:hypothetical protein
MEDSMTLEKGNSLGSKEQNGCRKRRGKSFWIKAVSDFEQSPLSMQDFCAERGLAVSTFHAWRRRLSSPKALSQKPAKAVSKPKPHFLPIYVTSPEKPLDKPRQPDISLRLQPPSTEPPESSLESLSDSSSGLSIYLNGGLKIAIDKEFHDATLHRLIRICSATGLETC